MHGLQWAYIIFGTLLFVTQNFFKLLSYLKYLNLNDYSVEGFEKVVIFISFIKNNNKVHLKF